MCCVSVLLVLSTKHFVNVFKSVTYTDNTESCTITNILRTQEGAQYQLPACVVSVFVAVQLSVLSVYLTLLNTFMKCFVLPH